MSVKAPVWILLLLSINVFSQNAPPEPAGNSPDELEKRISAAETYQITGDLDNARTENRAIVGLALRRYGNLLIEKGEFEEAVRVLTEAGLYFETPALKIDRAVAHTRLNDLDTARALAEQAVEADPENAYGHYILGNIHFNLNDFKAALPHLEKVLLLAPDFDAARALGLTYLHLRQPERARLLFEEIQASFEKLNPDLHILFGQMYEVTGYAPEAEREFKRALSIDPRKPRANFFLGYVILQHGGSERLPEAGQAFERELEILPDDHHSNFFAGVVASAMNEHERASGFLRKAIDLDPDSREAWLFLGQSQVELGELQAAEASFRRAVELSGKDGDEGVQTRRTHFMLGRLLIRTGRRDEGAKHIKISQELQKRSLESARDEISQIYGEVAARSGASPDENRIRKTELSKERAAELIKLETYLSDVLAQAFYNLGVIAVLREDREGAFRMFETASKWKPDFPNLARILGNLHLTARNHEKAILFLNRHLEAAPQDVPARKMLAAAYYLSDDHANAVRTLERIGQHLTGESTGDLELLYFYGVSLIRLEKNKEAVPVFGRLAEKASGDAEALSNAAHGFMLLGDHERAVKLYDEVLALEPKRPRTNYLKGQSLIRLNLFAEAEAAFRKESELDPENASNLYHIALTMLERKVEPEETFELLERAVALEPDHADARYQLGKIRLERGETERAISELEAAARAAPGKDYIFYQLSIAYRRASRPEDAKHALNTYQKLKAANRNETPVRPSNER